jgi:glycosyltransferase involved in cell wall biosynthesis
VRGDTLSGADRIFIECARRWVQKGHKVLLITCEEGYEMCQRNDLRNVNFYVVLSRYKLPLYLLYILRTIKGGILALKVTPKARETIVYSSSDFWPDSLPALILKLRFKNKIMWIAGFYLFAPNPFNKESPYREKRFIKGLLYYLSQIPIYFLIKKYADMVWVTNELDRKRFIDNRLTSDKVIVVRGGIDTKTPNLVPEPKVKKYDAVFIGRFHPQKGVLELIDIWRYVCERKKDAKLAMIGVGELESEVKAKIRKYGLENNVIFFGFKDGIEKLKIFKDSKVVVHPAVYDSGGMAACEAMVCGLPGVSFDLPALRTYYPKGMLKTRCYDLKEFAENILKLLSDKDLYTKTAKDALDWAKEWDWDIRAEELFQSAVSCLREIRNCK